jgi:hypothetical protein
MTPRAMGHGALHVAGATFAEIGRECGCGWRTVRKDLAEDAISVPPPPRAGVQSLLIAPYPARGSVAALRLDHPGDSRA